MEISNQDWKLLKDKLPEWQEAYMEKLCKEYIDLLSSTKNASEKFWKLKERIDVDRKSPGVCVDMRKSELPYIILGLLKDHAITESDLGEFSQELQEMIKNILRS